MNPVFAAGVADALEKCAKFGTAPVEGAVKTIGGVTKKFIGGRWVSHTGQALASAQTPSSVPNSWLKGLRKTRDTATQVKRHQMRAVGGAGLA